MFRPASEAAISSESASKTQDRGRAVAGPVNEVWRARHGDGAV